MVEAAVGIRQRLIKVGSGVKHPLGQDGFALVRHTEAAVRLQNVRRSPPNERPADDKIRRAGDVGQLLTKQ